MQIYYSTFDENKDEKIMGQELLKKVLALKDFNIEKLTIKRTQHQRPYCEELGFDFNISHTKGMALVVTGKRVGADCQKISPVKQGVINRVCSDEEIISLEKSQNSQEEFIRMWTFKEAFTKMIGSGFKYGFKNATIENAFCLYENIKIFQKNIDGTIITAVENNGDKIEFIAIQ